MAPQSISAGVSMVLLPLVMAQFTTSICVFGLSVAIDESAMDGDHLFVKSALTNDNKTVETSALIDFGVTRFAFIDKEFVRQHNLPTYNLRTPRAHEVIDGRPIASGDITDMVKIQVAIGGQYKTCQPS